MFDYKQRTQTPEWLSNYDKIKKGWNPYVPYWNRPRVRVDAVGTDGCKISLSEVIDEEEDTGDDRRRIRKGMGERETVADSDTGGEETETCD